MPGSVLPNNDVSNPKANVCTGSCLDNRDRVKLYFGSMVPCKFCFEICSPEGRGGEKGGRENFKTKHTEPLTQEILSALYCTTEGEGEKREGVQISKQSTQNLGPKK